MILHLESATYRLLIHPLFIIFYLVPILDPALMTADLLRNEITASCDDGLSLLQYNGENYTRHLIEHETLPASTDTDDGELNNSHPAYSFESVCWRVFCVLNP